MSHQIESVLKEAAADLAWPVESLSVERVVLERLSIARQGGTTHSNRRLAYAVVALFFVSAVMYLVPPVRQAVANFFGAAGTHITIGDASVDQAAGDLGLGTAVSLEDLDDAANFEPLIPMGSRLGPPDGVFVGAGAEVNMAWAAKLEIPAAGGTGIGVLLTQRDAALVGVQGVKTVAEGSSVEPVLVDGVQGFWIEGAHTIVLVDDAGREIDETRRLAANVLLWSKSGVDLRLETTADLATALELAESLG